MDKVVQILQIELAQKSCFLHIPCCYKQFVNYDEAITFLLYDLEC